MLCSGNCSCSLDWRKDWTGEYTERRTGLGRMGMNIYRTRDVHFFFVHVNNHVRGLKKQAVGSQLFLFCPILPIWLLTPCRKAGSPSTAVLISHGCHCQGQVWTLPHLHKGLLFITITGSRNFKTNFGSGNRQNSFPPPQKVTIEF